jgi:hypothetical protein
MHVSRFFSKKFLEQYGHRHVQIHGENDGDTWSFDRTGKSLGINNEAFDDTVSIVVERCM